jgi:hypothetical protein
LSGAGNITNPRPPTGGFLVFEPKFRSSDFKVPTFRTSSDLFLAKVELYIPMKSSTYGLSSENLTFFRKYIREYFSGTWKVGLGEKLAGVWLAPGVGVCFARKQQF